jgi:hypothetical protein
MVLLARAASGSGKFWVYRVGFHFIINILCMYDHFFPAGVRLNPLLKPTILHLHSIFVLDVDGHLHEHAKVSSFFCHFS